MTIQGEIIEVTPVHRGTVIGKTPQGVDILQDEKDRYRVTFRPVPLKPWPVMEHDLVLEVDEAYTPGQKVTLTIS